MIDELPIVLLHGSATGSYSWAAACMGINRSTLISRMKKLGIDPRQYATKTEAPTPPTFFLRQGPFDNRAALTPR